MNEIVLVGNPNTGKTTLFNSLSKSSEHTGNWHGVTVGSKSKLISINNNKYELVDLPGIYSLTYQSFEEKVACDYLYNNNDYLILNIVDVNNLYRNFYLTYDLILLNKPMILVINKISNAGEKIYNVNIKKLQEKLGIKVVEIDAENIDDIKKLKMEIINFKISYKLQNAKNVMKNSKNIEKALQNCEFLLKNNKNNINLSDEFIYKKCLENDEYIINKLNLSKYQKDKLRNIQTQVSMQEIIGDNYEQIKKLLNETTTKKNKVYGKSIIDKLILNKYLCLPIFFLVLILIFYLTFFSVGLFFSNILSNFINNIFGEWLLNGVLNVTNNLMIYGFFKNAIIGGVGAVFSFLPQVVMLFLCLGILEDSGYLSRVAFMLDDIFKKVGLSGKSVYTLLMGFGCSGIATLSARTVDSKNAQIKTAMITPYISCSAKLPIYTVLGSAFFGFNNVFIIFFLYLLGVAVALMFSIFYEKTFLKSSGGSFIMEFPPYRKIKIHRVLFIIRQNIKQFILRIGTILISVNIIVWIFSNFSFTFMYVGEDGQTIIKSIGKVLAPIFSPLGFGSWGPVSALVMGLIAKEMVVSSIAIFNAAGSVNGLKLTLAESLLYFSSPVNFTPASVISFLVFCSLYNPCIATQGVLRKEVGNKWFIISQLMHFVVSYLISFVVYNATNIIISKGILFFILILLMIELCVYSLVFFKKKRCTKCNGCNLKF